MLTITILGPGCANCAALERVTREAVVDLGLDAQIEKVTDPAEIMGYGIMTTPGLAVDGAVVLQGRVPTASRVRELLEQVRS